MGVRIRLSKQTLQIFDARLVRPGQWQHGYAVSKDTGIASGMLYPILMWLEKLGWLETRWEETRVAGRPPRHQYRLTPNGREWAGEEMQAAKTSKLGKLAAREAHG
jgi:PadR family transcriptional regulator PadR